MSIPSCWGIVGRLGKYAGGPINTRHRAQVANPSSRQCTGCGYSTCRSCSKSHQKCTLHQRSQMWPVHSNRLAIQTSAIAIFQMTIISVELNGWKKRKRCSWPAVYSHDGILLERRNQIKNVLPGLGPRNPKGVWDSLAPVMPVPNVAFLHHRSISSKAGVAIHLIPHRIQR